MGSFVKVAQFSLSELDESWKDMKQKVKFNLSTYYLPRAHNLFVCYSLKPRPNAISQYFNATYRSSVGCIMSRAFGQSVATYCDMFQGWCWLKFFMQHLWMLHDVVVVWPGSRNNVASGHVH